MPKSKIIKAVVDDEVSLKQSLTRLQVIAHDVRNSELEKWTENELVGYPSEDSVPEYRRVKSVNFIYSGINNYTLKVDKAPLDPSFLGTEILDQVTNVRFDQSISALENFLGDTSSVIYLDRSILAAKVQERSDGGLQCFSIKQVIPIAFFQNAIAEVKNRVLKSLLLLEEEYGNLDDLGVDISSQSSTKINYVNYKINSDVLHIQVDPPTEVDEPVSRKIAWNIIVPIIVGIICAVAGSVATKLLGA